MRITVALTPELMRAPAAGYAVAVVDVLRATTSLVTMFQNGLLGGTVADNVQQAREMGGALSLVCGEVQSLPPEGFDYGNSPAEFAGLSFRGQSAVMMTTNGTRALSLASGAGFAVAAAFVNRRAAAQRVTSEAVRRGLDIAVMCAGTGRGTAFSLEDTAAAGAIVEAAVEMDPALAMTDESWAALHLWHWYRGDAMRAFGHSAHGRALERLGFGDDLRYAAQVDVASAVPVVYREGETTALRRGGRRGR